MKFLDEHKESIIVFVLTTSFFLFLFTSRFIDDKAKEREILEKYNCVKFEDE